MKYQTSALMMALLASLSPLSAKDIPVVPYPKQVTPAKAKPFALKNGFTIGTSKGFANAAKLFVQDIDDLYGIKGKIANGKGQINLVKADDMAAEAYMMKVSGDGVTIKAGNYKSMVMGLTTLMQMIDAKTKTAAACVIKDAPEHGYRCFMLDVARQWVEFETIKQMVDLCRWYKVPYMQIHLSDDQQFTFESKLYPALTEGSQHYTQEQLKDLVEYATQRGVVIIPEFDLPGHSSAMRNKMPELFGKGDWGMIDLANPEAIKAVKEIAKEMMDIFHTSPYFHIGADEVWLNAYQELDHVKEYVAKNQDKFDGVHDMYLQFIVDMHNFVKANGKTTLVWESFHGDGSDKIKMPKDMIVLAWETLYQRPESLLANGFKIINATWKPCYTTPGRRWSPEYIFNWNPRLWENHWSAAPSYHNPIQLENNDNLLGIQMCAWEMIDHEQLLTHHERIPAFSENGWNDEKKQSYEDYAPRAEAADAKIMSLIFPAVEERSGFNGPDPYRLNQNAINCFASEASVFFKPFKATDTIYYTTDNSMPTQQSTKMTEPLKITRDMIVKYAMFDEDGNIKGYKSCNYQMRQIEFTQEGVVPERDMVVVTDASRRVFYDGDTVTITLKNNLPGSTLHYTLDGKRPTKESPVYTGPIVIDRAVYDKYLLHYENGDPIYLAFHASTLDENGNTVGHVIYAEFNVIEKQK